jgi:hypothetical protein
MLVACRTSAWRSVTRNAIGTNSSPMPTNSGARAEYIRVAAARICPQARRRARLSGAAGRQVVRERRNSTSRMSPPSTRLNSTGFATSRTSDLEPCPIAPQKKPVAAGPNKLPPGIV